MQDKNLKPKSELALLSEDITKNPNNPSVFIKRAIYFEAKDNLEAALMDYKECVRLAPNNEQYHFKLASLYFEIAKIDRLKRQYPEKAFFHAEKSLKLNPNYIPSLILKGELHLIESNLKESISPLNKVIELDYNSPKAHLLKGYIYSLLGEEDKAIQFFHNAIDIDVNLEDAYIQLGLIYQKNNDSTAVIYYKNTLRINPKNKLALYNLAKFYQDVKLWNESIKAYTHLLQLYPTYADGYYNIGFVHIKLGLYDIAANDFSQAISFNPAFFEAYFSRGHCFETLGDVYRAELDYKEALRINPDYQDAKDALKILYFNNQQIRK
ncbi:MAG: tetratricopeptide repeat protein [Flavobacteriales bacterium]|nr:tetratricopeptide repeat protein [Flavobacteriales bacterium]